MGNSTTVSTDTRFFGHPRGLAVLFFTEMWERFGYYGMRALLILYLTAAVTDGGMGFAAGAAGSIYALFTSLVYLFGLPGGWIADHVIGQRRAVLAGAVLISAGYLSMAVPGNVAFFVGLGLVVLGTGLLKTNISVIVGQLYAQNDERRDAGLLHLLHGHQPRRPPRAAGVQLPRGEGRLAPRLRLRRRGHDPRADPLSRGRPGARRGRPAPLAPRHPRGTPPCGGRSGPPWA